MPVIFGDKREDGKIVVGCIQHQIESHPNGISVDKVPEYPTPIRGKSPVQLFDPIKKEFLYEQIDRPLTKEEIQEDFNKNICAKLDRIIELLSKR